MTLSPRKRLRGSGADGDLNDAWVAANTFDFISPSKRGRRVTLTSKRRASVLATAKLKKPSPVLATTKVKKSPPNKNRRQSVLLKRLEIPEMSSPSPPRIYRRTRRQSMSHIPRKQEVKPPVPKSISERALPKPNSMTKLPPVKSQLPRKKPEEKQVKKVEEKTSKKAEETSKKVEKIPVKMEKKLEKKTPEKAKKVEKKTPEKAKKAEKTPKKAEAKPVKKAEVKAPKKAEKILKKADEKTVKKTEKVSKKPEEKTPKKTIKKTEGKTPEKVGDKASKNTEEKPVKKTQTKISPPRRPSMFTRGKSQPKLTSSMSLRGHHQKNDSDLQTRAKINQSETKKSSTVHVSASRTVSGKGSPRKNESPKQNTTEKLGNINLSPEKFYSSPRKSVYQVDEDISFTLLEVEENDQLEVKKTVEVKAKAVKEVTPKSNSGNKIETKPVKKSPLREKAKVSVEHKKVSVQTPRAPSPAKKRTRSSSVKVVKKVKITATSPEGTGNVYKRTPASNRITRMSRIGSVGASPELKESKVLKMGTPTSSHKTPKKVKPFTPKADPTPSRVLRQSMKKKVSTEIKAIRKVTNKENIEALLDNKLVSVTTPGKTPGKTSGMNSITSVNRAAVANAKMSPVKNAMMNSVSTPTKNPILMVSARSSVHRHRDTLERNDSRAELLPTTPVSLSALPSTPTSSKKKTSGRDGSIKSAYTGRRLLRMRQTVASDRDAPPRSSTPIRDITMADAEELDVTDISKDYSTAGEIAEEHINKFEDANEDDEQEEENVENKEEEEEEEEEEEDKGEEEEEEEEEEEDDDDEEKQKVEEAPPPSSRRYCTVM